MITFKQYIEFTSLPKFNKKDLNLLWHYNYWDGPISGMLSIDNQYYWFEMIDDPVWQRINVSTKSNFKYRRYAIIRMTTEQLKIENLKHADFRKYVGTHCDYLKNKQTGEINPNALEYKKYYDKWPEDKDKLNYSNNEVIGWFKL